MTTVTPTVGRPSPKMILVAALLVAVFAATIIDIVLPVTAVDIAKTFRILPGTVGQLSAFGQLGAVVTALLMGAFGFRFRYKSLVMIGILFIAACAIGLFLAPTFPLAQIIFPLNGIGSVLIVVTAQTFIGNSYPLDKKAKAIGWVAAAGTIATSVGAPVVGFMANIGGWRSVLVWFMLPIAAVSLIFVFLVFPFNLPEPQMNSKKEPFLRGFKQVLANKSAVACLASAFLLNASVFGGMFFDVTFYRQVFSVPQNIASIIGPAASTGLITVGAIIGGHTVNHVGRKRLAVVAIFIAGMLTLLSYFIPNLWLRVALHWTASIFGGVSTAAFANLMLEQVPRFRGTAMSLSFAFSGIGHAVGVTAAGAVLNLYVNPVTGFQSLGLAMGALVLAAVFVIFFLAKDPIKAQQQTQHPAAEPQFL